MFRVAGVAVVAGAAAFLVAHHLSTPVAKTDELAWLIAEFDLEPGQAAEVRALHLAFQPICEMHCEAIREAQNAVEEAETEDARQAAEARLAELENVCHVATREHLNKVAAIMPVEQRQRDLDLIEPRLSEHRQDEPFGLQ